MTLLRLVKLPGIYVTCCFYDIALDFSISCSMVSGLDVRDVRCHFASETRFTAKCYAMGCVGGGQFYSDKHRR